jgi:DNA-binding transcriptional MocR family regulator
VPSGSDEVVGSEAVLRALGKKYSAQILGAANEQRSAQELSDHLEIPIATSYRRIEELTELGLLAREEGVLTEARNRTDVFRRDVNAVHVSFGEGSVAVELDERSDLQNVIDDTWRSLRDDH